MKKALARKHLQNMRVLVVLTLIPLLKIGYLSANPRDILTVFLQIVAKRKLCSLILILGKVKFCPVLLPI